MNAALAYGVEHQPESVGYVRSLGVPGDVAEDVVQDAYVACLSLNGTEIHYPNQFWYKVLRCRAIDWQRANRRTESLSEIPVDPDPGYVVEVKERLIDVMRRVATTPTRRLRLRKLQSGEKMTTTERAMIRKLRAQLKRETCEQRSCNS